MNVLGLIFDFDGLILDTETPDYLAWVKVFSDYEAPLEFGEWADGVGKRQEDFSLFPLLQRRAVRPVEKAAIIKQHDDLALELILKQPIQPGIIDLLIDSRSKGLKLAIASSSDSIWVTGNLKRLDLIKYFDKIFTIEVVKRGKPDPELYNKTLEAFQLRPCEAIAIEDSPNGITAAKAAGLFCIAVPNKVTCKMDLTHANSILDTLENVLFQDLLEIVNHSEN